MKRVLLIEDDKLLSSILAETFRSDLFEVDCAFDGDYAISRAIGHQFDIVLLDILLPGKNGFEVLSALKALDATKDIPVIVMSNLSDEHSKERMKEGGALAYIVKANTTPQEIIIEVKKILEAPHS